MSDTPSSEESFKAGIAAFQKNDFNAARSSFQNALKQDPTNAVILFNLGLTEYRSDKAGLAIALWRKALLIRPEYGPAKRAITWARAKLEHPDIPHEVEFSETLRNNLLVNVSLMEYVGITVLLFAAGGWLLLGAFGRRRRALIDEKPMPAIPYAGILVAIAFVICAVLSAAKAIDQNETRATVIVKKIEARSTPDANGTPLFDLFEGLEVLLRREQGDWVQVSYPGGATGWIPKSSLFTSIDQVMT